MAQSPFAFYRGAAAIMAADLASTPASGLRVQACGDAHLMNFGGFATPERNIFFDINDFDETLPAPWEWDVKRGSRPASSSPLIISTCPTARRRRRRRSPCARTVNEWRIMPRCGRSMSGTTASISTTFSRFCRPERRWSALGREFEQARRKSLPESLFPKLVEQYGSAPRIKDAPPLIFHPTEEQAPGVRTGYVEALEGYRKSLPEHIRVLFDRFQLFDLAIKVVGVSSVGNYCALGLFMAADDDPIFLQVKEARKSVLQPYAGKSLHKNQGERIVAGQRLMQAASDIFLGWTRGVIGRDYYFRQLRDAKISVIPEGWDLMTLKEFGKLCAWALARAHARSGDPARIAGYMGSNTTFDDAVCEFAVEYADQNLRHYRRFVHAIREGRISVASEV